MYLGGATTVNAKPAAFARLAVDSGDGVTPYVAYEPVDAVVSIRRS